MNWKKNPLNLKEVNENYQKCYKRPQEFQAKHRDILTKKLSVDIPQESHDISKIGEIRKEEREFKPESCLAEFGRRRGLKILRP